MTASRRAAQPAASHGLHDRVLVVRDPGMAPAEAVITAHSDQRPHLVKVLYVSSRRGAWIDRTRIIGPAGERGEAPARSEE